MNNENEEFKFPESNDESPESPSCPHCEKKYSILNDLMDTFIALNEDKTTTLDVLFGIFEDLYDEIYELGEKSAYENVAGFAIEMAHENPDEE
jgi:hypothetical protein